MMFRSKTNLIASAGKLKNERSGEVVASILFPAGSVDQDIDGFPFGEDGVAGFFQTGLVEHVTGNGDRFATGGINVFGDFFRRFQT